VEGWNNKVFLDNHPTGVERNHFGWVSDNGPLAGLRFLHLQSGEAAQGSWLVWLSWWLFNLFRSLLAGSFRFRNPIGDEVFRTRPDGPRVPANLLFRRYLISPTGAKGPVRDVDHPPHLALRFKKGKRDTSTNNPPHYPPSHTPSLPFGML